MGVQQVQDGGRLDEMGRWLACSSGHGRECEVVGVVRGSL